MMARTGASMRFVDRLVSWSPVLFLGSLAALTYWLDAQVQPPPPRVDGNLRHDPDMVITQFQAQSFGVDGGVHQSLAAASARHFPDDGTVDFTSPAVTLVEPGRPKTSLEAAEGTLSGDRETIVLRGNVRAVQGASPPRDGSGTPQGPITLTTDWLRLQPKKGRADTDRPVTIEEPRGIIRTVGLVLDNEAHTLKLTSKVSGTLEPGRLSK
jgi:lipopolysaccharide export system protein LptC